MTVQPGKLTCQAYCWAFGGIAGLLGTVLLFLIGDFSSAQAIFCGILISLGVGIALSLLMCRSGGAGMPHGGQQVVGNAAHRSGTAPTVRSTGSKVTDLNPQAERAGASIHARALPYMDDAMARIEGNETVQKVVSKAETWAHKVGDAVTGAVGSATTSTENAIQRAKFAGDAASFSAHRSAAAMGALRMPRVLEAARAGEPDDLKRIKGVGPKLEVMLHKMGIYHFDQIAGWDADELAWVDENLEGFKGRASRDEWIPQATTLAEGRDTEFSTRVTKGDVY